MSDDKEPATGVEKSKRGGNGRVREDDNTESSEENSDDIKYVGTSVGGKMVLTMQKGQIGSSSGKPKKANLSPVKEDPKESDLEEESMKHHEQMKEPLAVEKDRKGAEESIVVEEEAEINAPDNEILNLSKEPLCMDSVEHKKKKLQKVKKRNKVLRKVKQLRI